jgi:fructose-1,6-bisphosphatase I
MPDSGWKDFHTLESYIAAEEKMHPQSRGLFSHLLRRVGLASKVINSKVLRAGLNDVLGDHGATNVQGESQMKLDVIANDIMKATFRWMPIVIGMASEEEDELISLPRPNTGMPAEDHYIIMFDPLDGSSNIDANVSVGTIFSIHRALSDTEKKETVAAGLPDFLQPGYKQEASGYVIYGSSTMFVYTTGHGVHGFTLDPEIGEYILSHENIRIPNTCKCFSANEGNYNKWDTATKQYADYLRSGKDERLFGGRLPPQPFVRWHLPLSGRCQDRQGKAAASLRGRPLGDAGRAGWRPRDHGSKAHPRRSANRAPPARAAHHRQQARGRALRENGSRAHGQLGVELIPVPR